MPTPYAEVFPFEKRYHYPHMKPADISIWERFIQEFPDMYERVQYSVPCGESAPFDTVIDVESGTHDEYLYKRKIDVVAFKGDEVDIIELKPRADAAAIGQVRMYQTLFLKDYKPVRVPKCIVITDELRPDIAEYAASQSVQMVVV